MLDCGIVCPMPTGVFEFDWLSHVVPTPTNHLNRHTHPTIGLHAAESNSPGRIRTRPRGLRQCSIGPTTRMQVVSGVPDAAIPDMSATSRARRKHAHPLH